MRAITLRQPWATLFVAGLKVIETRSWSTPHRGPLAVHASAKMTADEIALCWSDPFARALTRLGLDTARDLPVGAVLGTVDVVDCLKMTNVTNISDLPSRLFIGLGSDPRLTVNERAFGHYADGRFAWITGPRRFILDQPIPARGMLGLWELPADIAARLA